VRIWSKLIAREVVKHREENEKRIKEKREGRESELKERCKQKKDFDSDSWQLNFNEKIVRRKLLY
jgi:hypothetical protein